MPQIPLSEVFDFEKYDEKMVRAAQQADRLAESLNKVANEVERLLELQQKAATQNAERLSYKAHLQAIRDITDALKSK